MSRSVLFGGLVLKASSGNPCAPVSLNQSLEIMAKCPLSPLFKAFNRDLKQIQRLAPNDA